MSPSFQLSPTSGPTRDRTPPAMPIGISQTAHSYSIHLPSRPCIEREGPSPPLSSGRQVTRNGQSPQRAVRYKERMERFSIPNESEKSAEADVLGVLSALWVQCPAFRGCCGLFPACNIGPSSPAGTKERPDSRRACCENSVQSLLLIRVVRRVRPRSRPSSPHSAVPRSPARGSPLP